MTEQAAFLQLLRTGLPSMQAGAAIGDQQARFPQTTFDALIKEGLLTASLPRRLDGLGFGEGDQGARSLFHLLYLLGEADLSVARIYEAHVNALHLIMRYGTARQAESAARDAHGGHLFGLWVTDPPRGGARLDRTITLQGGKAFCSGAGIVTRALITAESAAGAQMLIVNTPAPAQVQTSSIRLSGMRAAITGSVDLTGMAVAASAVLGTPEDYLREPVFSAGAWRGAAAALGGLAALIEVYRAEIRRRGRDSNPHQTARFGQVVIAHETARLWMEQAAQRGCLEDGSDEAIVAYINLARIAVETACLDALRHIQRSLGLSAFMAGQPAERLCRDLATYLRQPAPDETLETAARYYWGANLPGTS